MKRKKDIPLLTESEGMSAMSDVVFLLLIFFIVTMSNYVEMTLLDIKIPTASSAENERLPELDKIVKIEIAENGQYIVNGIPMDRMPLLSLLKRYARLMPEADFLIRCHPESEHKNLVRFLADASSLELKNLKLVE